MNLSRAANEGRRPTPHLDSASALAALVKREDAIVLEFDSISMLWLAIYGHGARALVLPASNAREASEWLTESLALCRETGGKLYFVGILDVPKDRFETFLGQRIGIPYELLDRQRREARLVRTFPYGEGFISVHEVDPSPRPR